MDEDKKVKVYSTPTCPYCKMAKKYLDEKKIEYVDINVAENQEEARKIMEKSGQMGVPQLEIGDKIIVGYDEEAINKALGI